MPLAGPVATFFLLLGGSVLAGFVGHMLFRRYRFSDILLLLGVGVAAGPLLGLFDASGFAPVFKVLAPIGLWLVLFDGGLTLSWRDLRVIGTRAVVTTVGTWAVTASLLASIAYWALGFPPTLALLLGSALAGPGVTTLLPLLPHLGLSDKARAFATIELTLGSLLNAVTTTAIVAILLAETTPAGAFAIAGSAFAVGAAMGILVGLAWSRALHHLRDEHHPFPATLAVGLVAYVATEALGGSGFLMALAFGLVVGNAGPLVRLGGLRSLGSLDPGTRRTSSDLIFLFRSLYFVYLGLTVSGQVLQPRYALGGLALVACIVAVRALVMVGLRAAGPPERRGLTTFFVTMVPRGLSTAVVASVPASLGIAGAADLLPYVFFVILAANIVAMGGLAYYERQRVRDARGAVGAGEVATVAQ